eukprot:gene20350-7363_t
MKSYRKQKTKNAGKYADENSQQSIGALHVGSLLYQPDEHRQFTQGADAIGDRTVDVVPSDCDDNGNDASLHTSHKRWMEDPSDLQDPTDDRVRGRQQLRLN